MTDIKDVKNQSKEQSEDQDTSQTSEETRPEGQPEQDAPSDGTDEQSQSEPTTDSEGKDATGTDEDKSEGDKDSGETKPSNLTPEERAEYYKNKFSNSTRENQRLLEELKSEKTKYTNSEDVPTDDELSEKYPDFDDWSEDRKDNVRRSLAVERKTNRLVSTFEEAKQKDAWAEKASQQIAQDDRLEGQEEAFMEYVTKDENQGAPLQTLTNSFLYEQSQSADSGPAPQKNPALNTGSTNPQKSRSENKISGQEAKDLRENDYDTYVDKLQKGEIETE